MDERLRELERAARADPSDEGLLLFLHGLARADGPGVYLQVLRDLGLWDIAPKAIQDLAAEEVERRLGGRLKLIGARFYGCENPRGPVRCMSCYGSGMRTIGLLLERGDCEQCNGAGAVVEHRIFVFESKDLSGAEFSLVPGSSTGIAPLLAARHPVTSADLDMPEFRIHPMPVTCAGHEIVHRSLEHFGMRLPNHEEWLHACRAGTETIFYWGDAMDSSHVWHSGNAQRYSDGAVPPFLHDDGGKWNAFGLVDMLGNVDEMLEDRESVAGMSANDRPDLFPPAAVFGFIVRRELVPPRYVGFRPVVDIPGGEA